MQAEFMALLWCFNAYALISIRYRCNKKVKRSHISTTCATLTVKKMNFEEATIGYFIYIYKYIQTDSNVFLWSSIVVEWGTRTKEFICTNVHTWTFRWWFTFCNVNSAISDNWYHLTWFELDGIRSIWSRDEHRKYSIWIAKRRYLKKYCLRVCRWFIS